MYIARATCVLGSIGHEVVIRTTRVSNLAYAALAIALEELRRELSMKDIEDGAFTHGISLTIQVTRDTKEALSALVLHQRSADKRALEELQKAEESVLKEPLRTDGF
jgi:hypothetical protein